MMHVVSEEELRDVVHEDEALRAVEEAFRALGEHRVEQPPPMSFDFPDVSGEVHVKGAAMAGSRTFAVKIASGFYRNLDLGLPVSSGLVMVFDRKTGFPLAVLLDNAYLTEMRTAAAGALAARLLAPETIGKMAILGSGAQARYQLRAISRVRRPESVSVWSPTASHREIYCNEMTDALDIECRPASSAEDAVRDARLIVTVTTSRAPIVSSDAIRDDATVIAVGSDGPEKQELEPQLLARADKVVVDRLSQCVRLGEVHHAVEIGLLKESDVYAELGDVIVGRRAGRERTSSSCATSPAWAPRMPPSRRLRAMLSGRGKTRARSLGSSNSQAS